MLNLIVLLRYFNFHNYWYKRIARLRTKILKSAVIGIYLGIFLLPLIQNAQSGDINRNEKIQICGMGKSSARNNGIGVLDSLCQ